MNGQIPRAKTTHGSNSSSGLMSFLTLCRLTKLLKVVILVSFV
jgi:hypothetical protein